MPVFKLIFISVFSFIFNIFSMFPTFAKFIVEVLLTGVIIFKSIYQFCIIILNIFCCFLAFILFIVKVVILLSALYLKLNNFKFRLNSSKRVSNILV